jgi:PAS domain S-box-containing protein
LVLGTVLIAGWCLSALAFWNLRTAETLRQQNLNSASARTVQDVLLQDIRSAVDAAHTLSLVLESQPDLETPQLDALRRRILADLPALEDLRWHPTGDTESPEELKARVFGKPVASAPLPAADNESPTRVRIYFPVYERQPGVDTARRHLGFVQATVVVPTLVNEAAQRAQLLGLQLTVVDLGETPPSSAIVLFHSPGSETHPASSDELDLTQEVDVGTRPWQLVLHPSDAFHNELGASYAPYVLGAGIFLTLLLTLEVWRAQRYRRRIELAQLREQAANAQLHREQKQLQNVIDGTGVAMWEFNYQTRILKISERWGELSGFTAEELAHNTFELWQERTHPDDLAGFLKALRRHVEENTHHLEYEYRLRHKDGHWIWIGTRGRLIERDAKGKPLLVAGTNLEITARKEAEAQILALNASLSQRMQEEATRSEARATLGTLIASVSHEMGTPMGNSLMTASTLADQARQFQQLLDNGELRKSTLQQFVEQVRDGNGLLMRNLERAVALLKNFRQVAADQASEQRREFDLRQVLGEVLHTLGPSLKRESHTVTLDVPEGIRMDSYPGPLGQVVINLVNNAYLHAFEGIARGTVQITVRVDGEDVTLQCRDNGRGIAPDILEKMFQPFFSTRIGSGGTGLGMSIVDNLVKRTLGGSLHVDSVLGAGTTVTITVPRKAPESARSSED